MSHKAHAIVAAMKAASIGLPQLVTDNLVQTSMFLATSKSDTHQRPLEAYATPRKTYISVLDA